MARLDRLFRQRKKTIMQWSDDGFNISKRAAGAVGALVLVVGIAVGGTVAVTSGGQSPSDELAQRFIDAVEQDAEDRESARRAGELVDAAISR